LYFLDDIWRFTLLWTLIIYAVFHMTTAACAVLMQLGKGKQAFRWVWIIPITYAVIAGIEALMCLMHLAVRSMADHSEV
jgi:hypothetical protein